MAHDPRSPEMARRSSREEEPREALVEKGEGAIVEYVLPQIPRSLHPLVYLFPQVTHRQVARAGSPLVLLVGRGKAVAEGEVQRGPPCVLARVILEGSRSPSEVGVEGGGGHYFL